MKPCKICFESFIPRQTFDTLFTPQTTCQSCALSLERTMNENVVPLTGNTLRILTFEQPESAAFFHKIMTRILEEGLSVIFYDSVDPQALLSWRHLKTLLRPLNVYHCDFLTLDALHRLENSLE